MTGSVSRLRIWAAVLGASLGWGTSLVVTRVALAEGLEPLPIVAASSTVAAIAVIVFVLLQRQSTAFGPLEIRIGIVMSLMSVMIPFLSRSFALKYASAGFVGFATALVPLVTAIAAHFLLKDERLNVATVIGLGIALVGVAVLILSGDSGIGEAGRPALAGMLAMVSIAAVALGSVYAKNYAGQYSVLGVSGIQFSLGAVIAIVASLILAGIPENTTALGWVSLVYIGLIGTFMPVALFYWLIRHVTVTYSTIIGYIVPLIAVGAGIVFLDEQLQWGIVAGGALILAGVLITDRLQARNA